MNRTIILIFCLFILSCSKSTFSLKTNKVPSLEEVKILNRTNTSYEVYLNKKNKVNYRYFKYERVKGPNLPFRNIDTRFPESDFRGKQVNLKGSNGWIVGFNHGEFIGNLYWFDDKGSIHKKIYEGNVSDIFAVNGEIYAIEPLGGSIDIGAIIKIQQTNYNWEVIELCEFNTNPFCSVFTNNKFLIINSKGIIEISNDCEFKNLVKYKRAWWTTLYPNSVVVQDNYIYIGMRAGVLKIDSNDFNRQEWLTEN